MKTDKPENKLVLYQDENGITKVSVRFADADLWLTQNQIAEIYDTTKQNIGQHVKNILSDGELSQAAVVKDFFTTASDGKSYNTRHYNLDMITGLSPLDSQQEVEIVVSSCGGHALAGEALGGVVVLSTHVQGRPSDNGHVLVGMSLSDA